MSKMIDLTNRIFGRLKVLKRANDYIYPDGSKRVQWLCECCCKDKTKVIVKANDLRSGHTQSCGCIQREVTAERNRIDSKKTNPYDDCGKYMIGYTFKGEPFYVDKEDYSKIENICWSKDDNGYIVGTQNGKGVKMHRLIMGVDNPKLDVDHLGGVPTRNNNRKYNLRITTRSQNAENQKVRSTNTSGVTGVCWNKKSNKWVAGIMVQGKKIHLGYFENFDDAVISRKEAEKKYFKEYAYDYSQEMFDKRTKEDNIAL